MRPNAPTRTRTLPDTPYGHASATRATGSAWGGGCDPVARRRAQSLSRPRGIIPYLVLHCTSSPASGLRLQSPWLLNQAAASTRRAPALPRASGRRKPPALSRAEHGPACRRHPSMPRPAAPKPPLPPTTATHTHTHTHHAYTHTHTHHHHAHTPAGQAARPTIRSGARASSGAGMPAIPARFPPGRRQPLSRCLRCTSTPGHAAFTSAAPPARPASAPNHALTSK